MVTVTSPSSSSANVDRGSKVKTPRGSSFARIVSSQEEAEPTLPSDTYIFKYIVHLCSTLLERIVLWLTDKLVRAAVIRNSYHTELFIFDFTLEITFVFCIFSPLHL